jgi:hypothetical protein
MKNATLSIDDELLMKSRKYAQSHGTTLNSLVRTLLSKTVTSDTSNSDEYLLELMKKANGKSNGFKLRREDLYDV